jgi:hypothetical protein
MAKQRLGKTPLDLPLLSYYARSQAEIGHLSSMWVQGGSMCGTIKIALSLYYLGKCGVELV